jgi:transcriptional regulator of acetoin/glycerol metabolism
LTRNTGLTCCAAPIFDHRGQLVAVLDASGESDRAQQHTLVLVNMSAQMIENRLFLHRFRDAFVVRFHSRPELVGTWSEGIIALGLDGAIAAVDRNALFQLGCKSAAELTGAPLERLFNISLPALVARSHRKSFHPLPIYEARHGSRFFAVAQEPESRQAGSGATRTGLRSDGSPAAGRTALDELNLGDPAMARNIQAAKRVASRDVPILLVGETGTGKELFARALHAAGDRAGAPFVAINCAAIPEPLVAHELFGYPASANAAPPREGLRGKIAQANGGTLFLDEIDALPLPVQAQLLHLLEEGEIIALDTEAPIKVKVRVVSAVHSGLEECISRGAFRQDLFYRLQGLVLTLPPLRERTDKRELVLQVFAQEATETRSVSLSDDAVQALCAYQWPGNIRQLRNVLRGMIALRHADRLDLGSVPAECRVRAPSPDAMPLPETVSLNALGKAERDALLHELELEHGNISHVARKLGVSRNTLYRKMQRLRITWPAKRPPH